MASDLRRFDLRQSVLSASSACPDSPSENKLTIVSITKMCSENKLTIINITKMCSEIAQVCMFHEKVFRESVRVWADKLRDESA